MPDISTRLSNTGQLLVRSGIEIERILTSMVQDRDAVTAKLPAQQMFLSRLVCVDAEERHVIL
ncbi:MAG: Flagellar regulator YcgR, partial [Burkholderiales bacterium]|nr:Flagellar regulator YcgR [Burkholderiales bacterium]